MRRLALVLAAEILAVAPSVFARDRAAQESSAGLADLQSNPLEVNAK